MVSCRYHHVGGAIHILRNKIKLRHRSWIFKLRPNVADHLVARYNAGIYMHMPGGLEEMPLPRPKNIKRLSSLQHPGLATICPGSSSPNSIFAALSRLSPVSSSKPSRLSQESDGSNRSNGKRCSKHFSKTCNCEDSQEEDLTCPYACQVGRGATAASVATSGAGRVFGAVTHTAVGLGGRAVQEAQDVAEVLGHRTEHGSKSKPSMFSRGSGGPGSSASNDRHWTMWHTFGCVAMDKQVQAESSSSSDEEEG